MGTNSMCTCTTSIQSHAGVICVPHVHVHVCVCALLRHATHEAVMAQKEVDECRI